MSNMDLSGRTALVTGGSMGLGKAMATAFADAGANVALLARREEPLLRAKEEIEANARETVQVGAYVCDVAVADQITETFNNIVADLGDADILVNNAGRAWAHAFLEIDDEAWQTDLDLKLFAAIRLARLAFPGMAERRWGRIINVLSIAAKAPSPCSAPSSISRAAGMALTKVLAGEGAPYNILVNALLIGTIKTDQIRRSYDSSAKSVSFNEYVAAAGADLPMGRVGEAAECANVALFLASEGASYLTGCAINIDGGVSQVM